MTFELFDGFENPYKLTTADRQDKHHLQFDVTRRAYFEFYRYVPIKGVVDKVFSNQFNSLLKRMQVSLPNPETQPLDIHANIAKLRELVLGPTA